MQIIASVVAFLFSLVLVRVANLSATATLANSARRYSVPIPKFPDESTPIVEHTSIRLPTGSAVQCYAPATGQLLGLVNPSSPASIDRAIAASAAAQEKWRNTTFAQRKAVLRSLLRYVLDNAETISRIAALDSGKTMVRSGQSDVRGASFVNKF
jgi:acyl-CoA reductase-like NAD-dependent aldehyde dehydrogenase